MIFTDNLDKIKRLYNSLNINDEFEIMFNNFKDTNPLKLETFVDVLNYLKLRSNNDNLKLIQEDTLDINYVYDNTSVYRVTIKDNENINDFMDLVHLRKNNIIFSILMTQYLNNKNFKFINKVKNKNKIIDIDDYDIRVRSCSENNLDNKVINDLANIPISHCENIIYRYKNRISLVLIDNKDENLSIDLTVVKTHTDPNLIFNGEKSFEIEIDYSLLKSIKLSDKVLNTIFKETELIKQVMDKTNSIINKDDRDNIIKKYKNIVYGEDNNQFKVTYSMQPISLEVQHIVDKIPNRYSSTDKVDGENCVLFISDNSLYFITNNLDVRKQPIKTKDLNNTIIEGELVHLLSPNKYIFLGYDCLFYKNEDIRNKEKLTDRIKYVYYTMNALTPSKFTHQNYIVDNNSKYSYDSQKKFYTDRIAKYFSILNELIDKHKENDIVFYPKMFMFPLGVSDSEVFMFSYLMWYNCIANEKINCPYLLDGIIFTPLQQKYTRERKDQKFPIYKYKPPELNSIDVYIEFQQNLETGSYLDIFDNTLPDKVENQNYRVTNFYVGDIIEGKEVPVPFMPDFDNNEAFLPIIDSQVRDSDGNIVQSNTVIEIVYTNDPGIPHKYRWSVLRTRWDKTNSILKNKKKYGNFKDTAIKIWKSIMESIKIGEIKNLSKPDTYILQKKQLEERIDSSVIISERQQDRYYQKITSLGKKFREFNNWVKSVIIYTYCSEAKFKKSDKKKKRLNILDIGFGRGGDVMKFYHARVGNLVATDSSYEELFSTTDGAQSRYNNLKKKFPYFTKVEFIQLDGGIIFNKEEQSKRFSNMSNDNKIKIDKVFSRNQSFDIINSSLAIHYLFVNQLSINNLIENIRNNLKIGGFILLTLFDAEKVMAKLNNKLSFTSYYTDDDGKKNKFFEIVKKFDGELKDIPGQNVDVFMSWINSDENSYNEESLVTQNLMNSTMKKCGCYLVDTGTFDEIYNINKDWFSNVIQYEENEKNKRFYSNVAKFYETTSNDEKEGQVWSFLFRYYIYKRVK